MTTKKCCEVSSKVTVSAATTVYQSKQCNRLEFWIYSERANSLYHTLPIFFITYHLHVQVQYESQNVDHYVHMVFEYLRLRGIIVLCTGFGRRRNLEFLFSWCCRVPNIHFPVAWSHLYRPTLDSLHINGECKKGTRRTSKTKKNSIRSLAVWLAC